MRINIVEPVAKNDKIIIINNENFENVRRILLNKFNLNGL
jgi:hypothetical protein